MTIFRRLLLLALLIAALQLHAQTPWRDKLARALPLLGQRNWIVLAEPAYPLRSTEGIEVVATDLSQMDLLKAVLDTLSRAPHVRPAFYTDAELPFVSEQDAHGIGAYRAQFVPLLNKAGPVAAAPQEQLLAKLDDASRSYQVLVLKSTTTLPYSTIFIELDSGYWSLDAEKRLRATMQPKQGLNP